MDPHPRQRQITGGAGLRGLVLVVGEDEIRPAAVYLEVEAEQREILKVVRRLADEGQIQLGSKGGDDAFV